MMKDMHEITGNKEVSNSQNSSEKPFQSMFMAY